MTDQKRFPIVLAVLLCTGLMLTWRLSGGQVGQDQKNNDLIRLHIVANSNSPVDQAIKYQVRDAIVSATAAEFNQVKNIEQAKIIAQQNLDYIQQLAVQEVRSAGKDYPVMVQMGEFQFPAKTYHSNYSDFTLLAGRYEAVRVILGQGAGANWWCVIFPPLCFVDPGSIGPVEKKNGQEEIQLASPQEGSGKPGDDDGDDDSGKTGDDGKADDGKAGVQKNNRLNGAKNGTKKDNGGKDNDNGRNDNNERASLSDYERLAEHEQDAFSPAAPAFKLDAPAALVALNSVKKGENAWSWTMTTGSEQVEFRLKILDFFRQSGSWLKNLLSTGEERFQNQT